MPDTAPAAPAPGPTNPPPSASATPDAVKIPMAYPQPSDAPGPLIHYQFDLAESLLKPDATRGEKAYRCSQAMGSFYLYSLDPNVALNFPLGHRLEGRSRYNWVKHPDGISFGYLNADARADAALDPETKARLNAAYKARAIEFAKARIAADAEAMAGR